MNDDLISRKALRTDFQERLKNCDEWIANVANDHDLLTRALATRDFICEVLMTIDNAPTITPEKALMNKLKGGEEE